MEETDALRKGLRESGIDYTIMDWRGVDAHTMFEIRIGGVTCTADYYESVGRFSTCHDLTVSPRGEYGHDKVLELIDGVMGR